jgi:hypothetical protein
MVSTNKLTLLITDITISDQPQELARPTTRAGGTRYIQSAADDDEDDLTDDESVTELQGPQARVPTQPYIPAGCRVVVAGGGGRLGRGAGTCGERRQIGGAES